MSEIQQLRPQPELRLGVLTLGDVAHRRAAQRAFLGLQRAEADLDRHLTPVLTQRVKLEPGAHRTRRRTRKETRSVDHVSRPVTLRDQRLDTSA